MNVIDIREIYRNKETYLNQTVEVGGWVRSNRAGKNFGFLVVSDGTFFETLQVVYHDTQENFAQISKLNVGAAVIVKESLRTGKTLHELTVEKLGITEDDADLILDPMPLTECQRGN